MNILFTICGRAGSKGVKGKNTRNFLGIPLVWYTLACINLYQKENKDDHIDIVLNTDSNELINIVRSVDEVSVNIIKRNPELGGDKVAKLDVIQDCLDKMEQEYSTNYDIVVDLDITSPLRTVNDLKKTIERKKIRNDVNVVFTVVPSRRNPYFNMVREENGFIKKAFSSQFTTRQEAPEFYDMNASIYAYSPDAVRTVPHPSFFNSNCDAVIMEDTGILDIDSEEDYELMQVIASHLFQKHIQMKDIYNHAFCWQKSESF